MLDKTVPHTREWGDLDQALTTLRLSLQHAQHALSQANTLLEQRVAERTAALQKANADLQRAIARHRRTEAALRESEARLHAIGDAAPDIVYMLDEKGRYLEVLTSRQRRSIAALKGKRLADVHSPDKAAFFLAIVHQALATRQTQVTEYDLESASGRHTFESRTAPIDLPTATYRAVIVIERDITQRRLTEERLRRTQKLEALGRLTGGVAHDFNNLLAIIEGNLELLDEQLAEQPALQDLVRRADYAVERGTTLTRRLLAFSRQQSLQAQSLDLNRLVVGMIDLLRHTLGGTIQMQILLAHDLWPVWIDPAQLETALLNLALNARDAMPQGGRLTLKTANHRLEQTHIHTDVPPGDYVLLSVSDTGAGMTAEVLEQAFEPFFTTKAVGKGSGLGLSVVYGLVKQSQGHIILDSAPGRGTTVWFYLPRAPSQAALANVEALPSGQTVLVVEDDAAVRRLAVNMVQSLGYRALEASAVDSALAMLDRHPQVAVLFTEVVLPGACDGVELARQARQRRPELKVLLTSGSTEQRAGDKLEDGVELLVKPYRKADLGDRLRSLLGAAS